MKKDLQSITAELNVEIEEVNIDGNDELMKKYGTKIPVLEFQDKIIAKYSIRLDKLEALLKRQSDKS